MRFYYLKYLLNINARKEIILVESQANMIFTIFLDLY